jgi:hypothetical protein
VERLVHSHATLFRASGSRGDDPDVPGDASEGKYHVGERWNYRTRPGEEGSALSRVVAEGRNDRSRECRRLAHRESQRTGRCLPEDRSHALTEAAIDLSVTTRAAAEITVPADDEGYQEWRRASDAGRVGGFTITVPQAMDLMELGLRK